MNHNQLNWAMRSGFSRAANVPFNASVFLTHPANMVGQTIPSGTLALAFAGGVYTVPSGAYIYSASFTPGSHLVVANTADDGASEAGKLKHSAVAGVAIVDRYDSSKNELTFRTAQP